MALTDLPFDILFLIFPYLNAPDFLAFTSISKSFLSYRQDPTFWQTLTRLTFRVPSQPLLKANGARWQWLYRNLLTRTKVYTWGNNQMGNLGHHVPQLAPNRAGQLQHQWTIDNLHVGWPTQMDEVDHMGIVADIQCGGWSTVLLNSLGQLFAVGMLNGQARQETNFQPTRLFFPKGYIPTTKETYEPSTAIREYSVGRSHVLGLSDNGMIWHWNNIEYSGTFIKSTHVDMVRDGPLSRVGRVTRVTAGWSTSSAYVNGSGIIYWGLIRSTPTIYAEEQPDGVLLETHTVPGTSFNRQRDDFHSAPSLDSSIGEVVNHVVLENHIVFFTHLNKVFAFYLYPPELHFQNTPVELTTFSQPDSQVSDIQGSFRNFAVFTTNGSVLLGTSAEHLDTFCRLQSRSSSSVEAQLPQPKILGYLQNSSVTSIAFGDYHFHALHTNGTITAHGCEPKGCGALGLGSNQVAPLLRGIYCGRHQQFAHDGRLEIPSWSNGRRTVWFEPEKRDWLEDMWEKSKEGEARARGDLIRQGPIEVTQVVAEWFESEGADWGRETECTDIACSTNGSGEEMGAYFALKVTAAGWHSGALVLVDQEKADRIRRKYLVEPGAMSVPSIHNALRSSGGLKQLATPETHTERSKPGLGSLLYKSFYQLGKSFLGLIDSDATAGTEEVYAWSDQPFPRLGLPNGEAMPGEIPMTAWKGGEPVFVSGEETEAEL